MLKFKGLLIEQILKSPMAILFSLSEEVYFFTNSGFFCLVTKALLLLIIDIQVFASGNRKCLKWPTCLVAALKKEG